MRVRKLESDNCDEYSGNCILCKVTAFDRYWWCTLRCYISQVRVQSLTSYWACFSIWIFAWLKISMPWQTCYVGPVMEFYQGCMRKKVSPSKRLRKNMHLNTSENQSSDRRKLYNSVRVGRLLCRISISKVLVRDSDPLNGDWYQRHPRSPQPLVDRTVDCDRGEHRAI